MLSMKIGSNEAVDQLGAKFSYVDVGCVCVCRNSQSCLLCHLHINQFSHSVMHKRRLVLKLERHVL